MVYFFAIVIARIAIVLPELSTVSDAPSHNRFFYLKLSEFVLLIMPNLYDTPIQLYLCFVQ